MGTKREEWLEDINARQRNVVFPDTVENEARFWRNLSSGKRRPTILSAVGAVLISILALSILWGVLVRR